MVLTSGVGPTVLAKGCADTGFGVSEVNEIVQAIAIRAPKCMRFVRVGWVASVLVGAQGVRLFLLLCPLLNTVLERML